jgi:Fe-S cluster biogenesis protein NfuA
MLEKLIDFYVFSSNSAAVVTKCRHCNATTITIKNLMQQQLHQLQEQHVNVGINK